MAGLAAVRRREPSIEELVYQHEIAGDYGDALACYESMGKDAAKVNINKTCGRENKINIPLIRALNEWRKVLNQDLVGW